MRKIFKKMISAGGSRPVPDEVDDRIHVAAIPVVSPEAGNEDIYYPLQKPSLERLPTEIQSAILLNIRDVVSLKTLIHASPRYHSAYLSQRHAILKQVLSNSIHPDVLYDACSAVHSNKTISSNVEERAARVDAFLSEYESNRDGGTPPEQFDLESVSRLARLQLQVQHATEGLCEVAFSSHQFTGELLGHGGPLSLDEICRFCRAFYRFEIFCNLFRNRRDMTVEDNLRHPSHGDIETVPEIDSIEKSSQFLSLFNPWEVEELACVRDFLYNYYRRMLHRFEPDFRERNPNLDLSEDGPWLEENIEYFMALGLRFYRRLESSSPDRQMGYLYHGLHSGPSFLSDALTKPPMSDYRTLVMEDSPEAHFEGDSVRSGPNMIWLWTTGNKLESSYFRWQDEPLREWGYVFWDQKRLEKWNLPNEEYETWVKRRREGIRKALAEQSS